MRTRDVLLAYCVLALVLVAAQLALAPRVVIGTFPSVGSASIAPVLRSELFLVIYDPATNGTSLVRMSGLALSLGIGGNGLGAVAYAYEEGVDPLLVLFAALSGIGLAIASSRGWNWRMALPLSLIALVPHAYYSIVVAPSAPVADGIFVARSAPIAEGNLTSLGAPVGIVDNFTGTYMIYVSTNANVFGLLSSKTGGPVRLWSCLGPTPCNETLYVDTGNSYYSFFIYPSTANVSYGRIAFVRYSSGTSGLPYSLASLALCAALIVVPLAPALRKRS
ncbi:MAG: hypothetical protein ABWK00_01295 [Desulfurococcaceae archaeon]